MEGIIGALNRLRNLFPDESFEFGKTGNIGVWGDDRQWTIYCLSRRVKTGPFAGRRLSIYLGSTRDLERIDWGAVVKSMSEKVLKSKLADVE